MASNSLGTLTLDLIAKIGSFTGPLDKASQNAKKNMSEIKVSTIAAGVAIGELAADIIGSIPSAVQHLITGAADSAKEITNLSRIAGLSTTDFQKMAAGAATVGVEQDKLSDILKDVNDKVGDFMSTGGGAMQDFFTNIAPKVGVTADQFKKLNSADALKLYVSSLEKANVNQAEMTFYMEAIANDATSLVPLLRNGGKGFTDLGNAAEAAGAIMKGDTIAAALDFNNQLVILGQYVDSAKVALAADFLPVVAQFSKDINQAAKDAGGLKNVVQDLSAKLVETTASVADAADVLVRIFGVTSDTIVGMYGTAVGHMSSLMSDLATGLSKVTFGDVAADFAKDSARLRDEAVINFGVAAQAAQSIGEQFSKPLAGTRIREYFASAKAAYAESERLFGGEGFTAGTGSGVDPAKIKKDAADAKKAASDAEAEAKKLQGTFDSAAQSYDREIALINTSSDASKNATEVAKLRFEIESGKLVGLTAQQEKYLLGKAAELDVQKKLKQANEDEAKAAAYVATLRDANQTVKSGFDLELAGAGMGDKARDRLKQDLQIQQDYNQKMSDLQVQMNTGKISSELYKKETADLQDALAIRVAYQQDYYKKTDEQQSDWMSGVSDAWVNYKDQAADAAGQAKELFTDALSGTEDAIVDFIKTGKLSFKDLADSIIEDLIRIQVKQAAVGLLNSTVGFLSGGSQALGAATTSGFSEPLVANAKGGVYDSPSLSSFSGGVYDSPQLFAFAKGGGVFGEAGPEAIMPLTRGADGSLGVRAIGSGDSSSPEAALTGSSLGGGVTQHISVQGSADEATLARIQQAARQGAQDGYALVLRDLKQNGPARQLINRR